MVAWDVSHNKEVEILGFASETCQRPFLIPVIPANSLTIVFLDKAYFLKHSMASKSMSLWHRSLKQSEISSQITSEAVSSAWSSLSTRKIIAIMKALGHPTSFHPFFFCMLDMPNNDVLQSSDWFTFSRHYLVLITLGSNPHTHELSNRGV